MSISSEIQRINTNIANAYTQAGNKGATLPQVQNSANLAETISSIQTGGGTPVSVEEKDVNFYDYDGTRLYSYTLAEVQNLTELPALPSHTGLTCQGWNWTLADIKAEGKETNVGAMYITDDRKTRLYINIDQIYRKTVSLCFKQSVTNGVEVDWGDGSPTETFSGSGSTAILPTHTYPGVGKYVITLKPINNCTLTLGSTTSSYNILGSYTNPNTAYYNMLYKVELGDRISNIASYAFQRCRSLTTITIPTNITSIGSNAFTFCISLQSIIIPHNVTDINSSVFQDCYAFQRIAIPKTVTKIWGNAFQNCYPLSKITLPTNITSIGNTAFRNCYLLSNIIIPNSLTNIGGSAFYSCYKLTNITMANSITTIGSHAFNYCSALVNITIPNGISSIASNTFANCTSMKFYDFTLYTSIPSLANTDVFNNIPSDCKIVVPDALYDDWIAATNWSTYASYIIKKSDWDAL